MESLTSKMERFQLEEKVVSLMISGIVCVMTTPRRGIEFTCEHDGVEFTVGELKVLIFYFLKEKKFWYQLNCLLKSKTQVDYWLRAIIQQTFLNGCCRKPFTLMTF